MGEKAPAMFMEELTVSPVWNVQVATAKIYIGETSCNAYTRAKNTWHL